MDLRDGPEDHGRDWDLGNTETNKTDRASMAITGRDEDSQMATMGAAKQSEMSQPASFSEADEAESLEVAS